MKPTYLYIKQHSITGLKYFGKTTLDPYKYKGSGKYWKNHIAEHGDQYIKTVWVSEPFTDKDLISEFATFMSEELNIVESNEWANLLIENGLDGGSDNKDKIGKHLSEEHKRKLSESLKGKTKSESHKLNMKKPKTKEHAKKVGDAQKGRKQSAEHIAKLSAVRKGRIPWNKGKKLINRKGDNNEQ